MSLESKVLAVLGGSTALTALAGARIYAVTLPQGTDLPAVTFQRISGGHVFSVDGFSGMENPRIQIDAWAETYADARACRDAIIAAMLGATTFRVGGIESDQDLHEDDINIYRASLDFSCWHQE